MKLALLPLVAFAAAEDSPAPLTPGRPKIRGRAAPAPFRMREFPDGLRLSAVSAGNATKIPVVDVHGLTSVADDENHEIHYLDGIPEVAAKFNFYTVEYAAGAWTVIGQSLNMQVQALCKVLNTDEDLANAPELFLIGHSNGGIVSRATVERCELGTMKNGVARRVRKLISVGGPQQGVRYIPGRCCKPCYGPPS